MQGRAFYDAVRRDARFEWLGCRSVGENGGEVFVGVRLPDEARQRLAMHGEAARFTAVFAFDIEGMQRVAWRDVEAILLGRRRPKIMRWVTRIVGYYSNLASWNRSKLAELHDRQKGNYAI